MSSPPDKTDLKETFGVVESIDALAESNPELYEAIRTIEGLDTKLYETIQSHFSNARRPSEDLPTPTDFGERASRKSSRISTHFRGQSRRFSLDTLPPTVAEIMALFDFDGDGKVTLDEVRQGAQELKESKKKNKIAIWAMVIQFLVYTALTAGSCGVLYHFLYLMKDTTVDPSTGSLMVKDGEDNEVEVSVKSRGEAFSYDTTVVDAITGEEKGCVSGSQAAKMFEHVLEGTTLKFVEEDITTGTVNVISVGTNSSVWSDSIMDLGGLVLVPDADCSRALVEEALAEVASSEGNRFLSVQDVLNDVHIASRAKFMQQHFGSTTMARRLGWEQYPKKDYKLGYSTDEKKATFIKEEYKEEVKEEDKETPEPPVPSPIDAYYPPVQSPIDAYYPPVQEDSADAYNPSSDEYYPSADEYYPPSPTYPYGHVAPSPINPQGFTPRDPAYYSSF